MKFREQKGVAANAPGVMFFASCLDEALYEYTPATYKPRVMSVRSLAFEAKSVIARVEAGAMDRARLYPILDELKDRLQHNSVARGLLSFPVEYYSSYTKEEGLKSITTRLGLLKNSLAGGRYRAALQHEIIRLCQDERQKLALRNATKSWVSAMGGLGFSRQFVHEVVKDVFFEGETAFTEPADLVQFFDRFLGDRGDFNVAFAVGEVIAEISETIKKFKCEVLGNDHDLARALELGAGERAVLVKEVSARDHYSARSSAERRLEHITDLFAIFHHKNRIKWRPEVAVRRDASDCRILAARASSVARSRDNVPKKASQKLAAHVGELEFSDRDSLGRFISVVRLHGAAQEAASSQAQLVNLWTAMEVLVSRESESKMRGVKRCITPFLVYGYVDRMLYGFAGDLYRWKRKQTSRLLRKIDLPGWSQHQKLAAILLGGGLESSRNELYALLEGFPLLRNRCFQLSKLITNADVLNESVKAHEQRVAWQIERIYRSRNSIVHDGSAPPHVDALTENAHEYLDAFIDRFFILCSQMKVVTTLDEAIAYQTRLYDEWRSQLATAKKNSVEVENVRRLCALDAQTHKRRESIGVR